MCWWFCDSRTDVFIPVTKRTLSLYLERTNFAISWVKKMWDDRQRKKKSNIEFKRSSVFLVPPTQTCHHRISRSQSAIAESRKWIYMTRHRDSLHVCHKNVPVAAKIEALPIHRLDLKLPTHETKHENNVWIATMVHSVFYNIVEMVLNVFAKMRYAFDQCMSGFETIFEVAQLPEHCQLSLSIFFNFIQYLKT